MQEDVCAPRWTIIITTTDASELTTIRHQSILYAKGKKEKNDLYESRLLLLYTIDRIAIAMRERKIIYIERRAQFLCDSYNNMNMEEMGTRLGCEIEFHSLGSMSRISGAHTTHFNETITLVHNHKSAIDSECNYTSSQICLPVNVCMRMGKLDGRVAIMPIL